MPEPLSPQRIAEIRERVSKAAKGPYTLEWDSCDCDDPGQCHAGHRWVYALRLPEPHIQRKGESRPWDSLYSEMGHFTPETALFFAAARQDVEDLLAEVDRRLPLEDVERFLKRERDEYEPRGECWNTVDDVLDCFRLHMVTGTLLTDPRPEEGPGDPSVGPPPLTEAEELRAEVGRLKAENELLRRLHVGAENSINAALDLAARLDPTCGHTRVRAFIADLLRILTTTPQKVVGE